MAGELKPIVWMGRSLDDLRRFPDPVKNDMGFALFEAQTGGKALSAKPLKGFHGAATLEIVENHDGETYRAVYTVRFEEAVYVLHCFQKKSKSGIETPKKEVDLIRQRLKAAAEEHEAWKKAQTPRKK